MRWTMAILLALVTTSVNADDIRDYVRFQKIKLHTYADAEKFFEQTKKPVIVWVGDIKEDDALKLWRATEAEAYHCFVKDLPATKSGSIVVAGNQNGSFVRFSTFRLSQPDLEDCIKQACVTKFADPVPQIIQYQPQYSFPIQGGGCANGRCPR